MEGFTHRDSTTREPSRLAFSPVTVLDSGHDRRVALI
jgi:hypothetical protein